MKSAYIIILLTIAVFFLSKNPATKIYSFHLALLSLLFLLLYIYLKRKRGEKLSQAKGLIYLITLFILSLVASTGWFLSPFFFTLYLLAILLSFTISTTAGLAFTATLIGLFTISIGEIDFIYDLLVILSYLTVIPLIFYLKKQTFPL